MPQDYDIFKKRSDTHTTSNTSTLPQVPTKRRKQENSHDTFIRSEISKILQSSEEYIQRNAFMDLLGKPETIKSNYLETVCNHLKDTLNADDDNKERHILQALASNPEIFEEGVQITAQQIKERADALTDTWKEYPYRVLLRHPKAPESFIETLKPFISAREREMRNMFGRMRMDTSK